MDSRLPGAGGKGKWESLLGGYHVSVWGDERVLERDGWAGGWLQDPVNGLNAANISPYLFSQELAWGFSHIGA